MTSVRGFSLIELFTVVAILGVLAGLALPAIAELAQQRAARTEVAKVKATIESARDAARARLRCMHVTNPTSASLQVEELQLAGSGCSATVVATEVTAFSPRLITIPAPIDIIFDRTGGVVGTTASFTDFTVAEKRPNTADIPQTLRVFSVLGLVRRL